MWSCIPVPWATPTFKKRRDGSLIGIFPICGCYPCETFIAKEDSAGRQGPPFFVWERIATAHAARRSHSDRFFYKNSRYLFFRNHYKKYWKNNLEFAILHFIVGKNYYQKKKEQETKGKHKKSAGATDGTGACCGSWIPCTSSPAFSIPTAATMRLTYPCGWT